MEITAAVAARLESAEALDGADCADAMLTLQPESEAAVKAVGGGFLFYLGAASPLTHVLALGMHGAITAQQLDEVEEFYRSRDVAITIDVCPHADPTLLELLSAREYRVTDFANVMVRPVIASGTIYGDDPGIEVVECSECEAWGRTVVCGFFGRESITDAECELGRILFHMRGATPLIATVDGVPAGGGGVSFRNRIASCFADATLVRFRRRGVHRALIRKRLRMAIDAGCDLITAGTQPGSSSQRDYERFGFQVAYTKITMSRE